MTTRSVLLVLLLATACSGEPAPDEATTAATGAVPAAFRGRWEVDLGDAERAQLEQTRAMLASGSVAAPLVEPTRQLLTLMESLAVVEVHLGPEDYQSNLESVLESQGANRSLRAQPMRVVQSGPDGLLLEVGASSLARGELAGSSRQVRFTRQAQDRLRMEDVGSSDGRPVFLHRKRD